MGFDITAFVEVQTKDNRWHYYSEPDVARDSELFGSMGQECRGIPEDCSGIVRVRDDSFEGLRMNESWLSSKEFLEITSHHGYSGVNLFGCIFGVPMDEVFYWRKEGHFPEGIKDFRLVFWLE